MQGNCVPPPPVLPSWVVLSPPSRNLCLARDAFVGNDKVGRLATTESPATPPHTIDSMNGITLYGVHFTHQSVDDEFTRLASSGAMASEASIEAEHRVIEELGPKRRLLMAVNESKEKPVRLDVHVDRQAAVQLGYRPVCLRDLSCFVGLTLLGNQLLCSGYYRSDQILKSVFIQYNKAPLREDGANVCHVKKHRYLPTKSGENNTTELNAKRVFFLLLEYSTQETHAYHDLSFSFVGVR